jgi:Putative Ig domain
LTFDPPSLTLSGTPTTAGSFSLTIQVADSANLTTTRSLSLTVNPTALSITTSRQLPDARLNQPYVQSIAASGGQPPYQWSMNGQPAGLAINSATGQITGTPTAAGNFGIAITVRDSALSNFSDRFTLAVDLPSGPGATISGLPATAAPAQQYTLQIQTDSTYPAPISGQAILSFSPDTGPADRTIQFSTGGTTASFDIPVGSTTASAPLAIQTGTVSGTINITLRLQAGGIDITPSPAPAITAQVARAAPVIKSAQVNRSGSTINIVVTGYSTAREVTQAVFAFNAASGQTLSPSASSITVDTNSLFGNWFVDPGNSQFGSVFIFTQPFTVQGDATAVIPASVTLTNRTGSVTANISQ